MDQTMIVAGIGCKRGVRAIEVEIALESMLLQTPAARAALRYIAIPAEKHDEAGIIAAAAARNIALKLISRSELVAANARTQTRSARALAIKNVHSVAEAAALAGAGPTAQLLAPRIAVGPVTCALAIAGASQ